MPNQKPVLKIGSKIEHHRLKTVTIGSIQRDHVVLIFGNGKKNMRASFEETQSLFGIK
jgi:hypothetical protein